MLLTSIYVRDRRRDQTGRSKCLIPNGVGKQVSGGQVWSTSLGGGGDLNGRKFVHVGATGVSAIDDDRGKVPFITDEALETLISSLSVEWAG